MIKMQIYVWTKAFASELEEELITPWMVSSVVENAFGTALIFCMPLAIWRRCKKRWINSRLAKTKISARGMFYML